MEKSVPDCKKYVFFSMHSEWLPITASPKAGTSQLEVTTVQALIRILALLSCQVKEASFLLLQSLLEIFTSF